MKKKQDYRKINFAGFDVIYLVLNKSMYDLFFKEKKEMFLEAKSNYEEDNYLLTYIKQEKDFDAKMNEDITLFGETKTEPNNNSLKEIHLILL